MPRQVTCEAGEYTAPAPQGDCDSHFARVLPVGDAPGGREPSDAQPPPALCVERALEHRPHPQERGKPLSVVADSEVVRLGSDHLDDVFVELSLFFLKGSRNGVFGSEQSIWGSVPDAPSGLLRPWQCQAGGRGA